VAKRKYWRTSIEKGVLIKYDLILHPYKNGLLLKRKLNVLISEMVVEFG
jgi:hypothetical protein